MDLGLHEATVTPSLSFCYCRKQYDIIKKHSIEKSFINKIQYRYKTMGVPFAMINNTEKKNMEMFESILNTTVLEVISTSNPNNLNVRSFRQVLIMDMNVELETVRYKEDGENLWIRISFYEF